MEKIENVKKPSSTRRKTHPSSINVLELRLEEFVKRFVKEFEAKLTSYSLILDVVIPKSGKHLKSDAENVGRHVGLALGGAAGMAVGCSEIGAATGKAIVGNITKIIEEKVKHNHIQNKVTKLSDFINYFEKNRPEFRKLLVRVGLDIFQSFEIQFGRVTSELGERGAMNQLAIDAMNRAIEYIGKTSIKSLMDHHSLILEGVKFGHSKREQVLGVPVGGRRPGFEIKYKLVTQEETWTTSSLYSKVGIVIINKRRQTYYNLNNGENKTPKYGFRRCFTYEKWEELIHFYIKTDLSDSNGQFLDYDYYFNADIVNEKINDICAKLQSERDKKLGIDRINNLIMESRDEILEKLRILKPIYDKMEQESKMLSNIESDLKNLKVMEYFSMFDLKMNGILDEISKGNNETHSKLEKITNSLEELNEKLDILNRSNSESVQNSVWFDVRNELLAFTGRETILDQIERDLDSGPVVICGLGGIGKSELAVKYAHNRYDKADNVIWVNAETEESIAGSIWQLAQTLNVNKMDNFGNEKHIDFVISEIYKIIFNQRCLLILDNAKNFSGIELLLKWGPDVAHNQPKVIITSRNSSEWESARFSIKIVQLEVFDRFEAIEFVVKSLSLEHDSLISDIDKLIDVLGNFPLALQLAVTNIKITNSNYKKRNKEFTIKIFLEKFKTQPQKLMCGKLPLDMYRQPYSIFKVIGYTFKDLETDNELGAKAQLILKMASYLAPDNIREDFFEDEFDSEDELIEVMNLLENYSLVKINDGKLNVHRLVQQSIRFASGQEEEIILRKNLNLLMKRLTNWDNITFYTPHIISIWDYACDYKNLIEEFIINSSTKFYIYTSFLETLVQRNRLKVVNRIINQIEHSSSSNKLIDILRNLFGEKSIHFAITNPEMVQLLKEHGVHPPNSKRNPSVMHSAFSLDEEGELNNAKKSIAVHTSR